MTVLRDSSLAAVIILVWSTSENLSCCVSRRTSWRLMTMSLSLASFIEPVAASVKAVPALRGGQHRHAALDIERRAHAFERQAQLDQRDGDGGLHADHHRRRIQHAGDAG